MTRRPCPYGSHRSLEPAGSLPQPAWRIDNCPDIAPNELLIRVDTLNVDAASFTQLEKAAEEKGGSVEDNMAAAILDIVARRGKLHNPVTGSGGMLLGTVERVGPEHPAAGSLQPGIRIATLVSLSLTPLKLERIRQVNLDRDQVEVDGRAVLFASGIYAPIPTDLPETLALAVLDVAGAPAQTARLVRPGDSVLVIGAGGKSGLLCLHEARKRAGVTGRLYAMAHSPASVERAASLGISDAVFAAGADRPLEALAAFHAVSGGEAADVTINCVNVPGTEMTSVLCTREGGTVYFFSMATSFTAAALGAEGIGRDVNMIIGNGYARGHDLIALACLRENSRLKEIFESWFV
ncbi:MAG: L-erythro-3,5-diaminohexanoate dehydrogenase [bacterium]|nr:L-erythro-3,5-diaminohexanoate dehydrogenase [bacterium]